MATPSPTVAQRTEPSSTSLTLAGLYLALDADTGLYCLGDRPEDAAAAFATHSASGFIGIDTSTTSGLRIASVASGLPLIY